MRLIFSEDVKIVRGNTNAETALSDGAYPASGSYVDVSGYEAVDIVIHLGTLANTVSFTVKQADANDGSLDTISTANCVHTVAANDDGEFVTFHIETQTLAADHHFLAVSVGSAGTTADYADINFFLHGARHLPVTQASAQLPSASQNIHAG